MKFLRRILPILMASALFLILSSCDKKHDGDTGKEVEPGEAHFITLYDGDRFKGDQITIDKEGAYPNLDDLPGSDGKNWTDEADSYKIGKNTTVVIWTEVNFQGDSVIQEAGEYPSEDEPHSLKIYFDAHIGNGEGSSTEENTTSGETSTASSEGSSTSGENGNGSENPAAKCMVTLFDGDNFKDDSIDVETGEYANLDNLPESEGKNWTDEADSFKVGEGATLTVWTETDFKGESKEYGPGEYPSVNEPYSMKITCE